MSEKELTQKIQEVYQEINKTTSQKRKNDLNKYLKRLKKDLQIYKQIRYNIIQY